jgi:hypothetical protein
MRFSSINKTPPNAARLGSFITTGTATLSLLTAAPDGPVSILAPGTLIDGTTAGAWSGAASSQLLFDYAVTPNTFDPDLLSDTTTGIMGIRITSGADFYYGWFQITSIAADALSYAVQGLVYNNTPNAGVLAGNDTDPNAPPSGAVPEPSSVGMIVLGAAGVYALRRRRDA